MSSDDSSETTKPPPTDDSSETKKVGMTIGFISDGPLKIFIMGRVKTHKNGFI